jgi:hypothetical protein
MNTPEPRQRSRLLWPLTLWGICIAGLGVLLGTAIAYSRAYEAEIVEVAVITTAAVAAGTCTTVVTTRRTAEFVEATGRFLGGAFQGRRAGPTVPHEGRAVPEIRRFKADDSGFHYVLSCGNDADGTGRGSLATVHQMPRRRRTKAS